MRTTLILLFVASLALFGCETNKPIDLEALRQQIRNADANWSAASHLKDVDRFISFVSADCQFMPPVNSAVVGALAIRGWISEISALPGFDLRWRATTVELAPSGDLGYTTGNYNFRVISPDGSPVSDVGTYATIWRKQADGTWKVVVNVFSSFDPLPGWTEPEHSSMGM